MTDSRATVSHAAEADHEALALENEQLRDALQSRDVIGQAKGMIRLLTGCDSPRAFEILTRISQDTNRKLRSLAELIAETAPTGVPLPADVIASWRRHAAPEDAVAETAAVDVFADVADEHAADVDHDLDGLADGNSRGGRDER